MDATVNFLTALAGALLKNILIFISYIEIIYISLTPQTFTMNICYTYFPAQAAVCSESLLIKANLSVSGSYTCILTDKFNNRYTSSLSVDSQGSVSLDLTQFPQGLFTSFAGTFQLTIYNQADNTPVPAIMCGTTYNGFTITFYNTNGGQTTSVIEC